jgi:pimeloyl-ACP methyl ester carboxylesterase
MEDLPTSSLKEHTTTLYCSERGTGEPIVFIHGICGDYRMWDSQLLFLSARYRAISYSRRSSRPNKNEGDIRGTDAETNSEDLLELFGELDLSNAHIVGHSYGGSIAAYFAYKHPEKVRSLVLIEPALISVFIENPNSAAERLFFLLVHPSSALALLDLARKSANPSLKALAVKDSKKAARIFVDGIQNKPGAFEGLPENFRNIVTENVATLHDLESKQPVFKREQIRQIKIPTLIVKGETSHKILRDVADTLCKILPNSRLEVIHSGHFPQFEKPEILNLKILDFLDRSEKVTK